jgi:hypothetical protein
MLATGNTTIPFSDLQRQKLRDLSNVREDKMYLKENKRLEDYIETLRDMYPEYFHRTKQDFNERVFFDEPASEPNATFLRPRSKSPYLNRLK